MTALAHPHAALTRRVRYWSAAVPLTAVLVMVVAARAHELVPGLPRFRPALVLMALGLVGLAQTPPAVLRRVGNDQLTRFTVGYFAWAVATVPFALYISLGVTALTAFVVAVYLVVIVMICPPTLATLDRLQGALVTGVFGTSVVSVIRNHGANTGRLSQGNSLDSNDLAALVALSIPLALGLALRLRGRFMLRLYYLGAAAAFAYTLVRTGSRGGLLAIGVAVLVLIAGLRGARRWAAIAGVAIGAVVLWKTGGDTFHERVASFVSGQEDYNYTSYGGRKHIWERARGYIAHNPVFGVGVGNFSIAEGESCKINFPDSGCKWSAPHNSYLQAGAELGLPGLALFVGILVTGARRAYRFWRTGPDVPIAWRRPELLASLVGFSVSATFLSHAYFPMLFALVALIGLATFAREDAQQASGATAPSGSPAPPPRRAAPGAPRPPRGPRARSPRAAPTGGR